MPDTEKRLRETYYGSKPHVVDREAGVIRGVKIIGHESQWGHKYTPQAISQAAKIYEGLGCYINHQSEEEEGRERDFDDLFGRFENVTHTEQDAHGDLHFMKSHTMAERVCEAAERFPQNFGLSHAAYGKARIVDGQEFIESISRVNSVDIVTSPATTKGLFESFRPPPPEPTVNKKPTSIRKLLEAAGLQGVNVLKRLKEADPQLAGIAAPAMLDAPIEVEAVETDPTQMLQDAIEAQITAIVRDTGLDLKGKLAAIEQILTAHSTLTENKPPPAPTESSPPEKEGDTPVSESIKLKNLEDKLTRMEAQSNARKLIEAAGVEALDERVEVVSLVTDPDKQKRLIESWPKKDAPPPLGERPPFSRPLREAANNGPPGNYSDLRKEFESRLPKTAAH